MKEACGINSNEAKSASGDELYSRFQAGDERAFEDLVAMYETELFHFINGIVHDYHEAKHLMIEAFARLALKGGRFEGRSSLKTYLYTIAKNLAIRYVKMRGKEKYIPFEEAIETVTDADDSPVSLFEREDDKLRVHEALKGLKEEYRVVINLLYFKDMSYREAGRIMYKNERQIEGLARRAKAALKSKLESGGFVYDF